jgi:hypothetical protein
MSAGDSSSGIRHGRDSSSAHACVLAQTVAAVNKHACSELRALPSRGVYINVMRACVYTTIYLCTVHVCTLVINCSVQYDIMRGQVQWRHTHWLWARKP